MQLLEIENPYLTKVIHILKTPTVSFKVEDKAVRKDEMIKRQFKEERKKLHTV